MKPLLVLTSLLLVTLAGLAQNAKQAVKIDSLRRVIATTRVDTVRGRTLCRLCDALEKVSKYEEALAAGEQGLEISRKVGDRKGEARCLNEIGGIYYLQASYRNALDYFQHSLKLAEEIRDWETVGPSVANIGHIYSRDDNLLLAIQYFKRGLEAFEKVGNLASAAKCLQNIGVNYEKLSDYSRALEHHNRSLKVYESIGDQHGIAACLNNIGHNYSSQGNYPRALENFHRSLRIYEAIGDQRGIAACLCNIGLIYESQDNYSRATEFLQRSLSTYEKIGDPRGTAALLGNLGLLFMKKSDFTRALQNFQRSLTIHQEIGDRRGVVTCLANITTIYNSQSDYQQLLEGYRQILSKYKAINDRLGEAHCLAKISICCLKIGRPDSALLYAQKSLILAQKIGNLECKRDVTFALYRADSALGNWKEAFEAARLYHIYSDSLKNDEKSKELGRLEARYESEQEIARLEADRLRQDLLLKDERNLRTLAEINHAKEQAQLEAHNLRLAQEVQQREQQRVRDSLEQVSLFERLQCERVEKQLERERSSVILTTAAIILLLLGTLTFTQVRHRRRQRRAYTQLEVLFGQLAEQKAIIEEQNANLARQGELLAQQNLHLQLAYEDLKLEQEARMQAQRLAGIGEISAIIAHEVNTPLSAIVGGVENLMQRIFDHAAELEGIQPERHEELRQNLSLAAAAAPLSSREERAAIRQYEAQCAAVGFPDPEAAARLIVQSGLREAANERTLRWAAERPTVFRYLVNISQQLSQLATIRRAAQQAAGTITILRAYTQQSTAQQADACPVETLRLVLKLYDYHLNQGIHLELDAPENPPRVVLDASSLIQIWTKLLLFSMYGMRKHGLLRIRFEVGAGSLQVFWSDNGPQPDAHLLAQAFDPGTNLRQTDPAVGLWLCRSLLENQGGSIGIGINEQHELTINCWMPLSRQ